jgi:hypothetical protein
MRIKVKVKEAGCDGWRGNDNTGVREWGAKAVMKIKDKNKLIYSKSESLAGATSCSSLVSNGLSTEENSNANKLLLSMPGILLVYYKALDLRGDQRCHSFSPMSRHLQLRCKSLTCKPNSCGLLLSDVLST